MEDKEYGIARLEEAVLYAKDEVATMKERIDGFEIDPDNYEDAYDDFLDEHHCECELCKNYGASKIIQEIDPVLYRCGFSDFLDTLEVKDDEYYQELEVELEALEYELLAYEDELEEMLA